MKRKITTTEAMVVAADHGYPVSRVTMITWAKKKGLGIKVGGRWYIEEDLLKKLFKGGK